MVMTLAQSIGMESHQAQHMTSKQGMGIAHARGMHSLISHNAPGGGQPHRMLKCPSKGTTNVLGTL